MDGIRSAVRRSVLACQGIPDSPSVEPVWGGTVAYRGLVPRDVLDRVWPGHRAIATPMMVRLIYVWKIGFTTDEEILYIVRWEIQGCSILFLNSMGKSLTFS
jgi:hypothetical protein